MMSENKLATWENVRGKCPGLRKISDATNEQRCRHPEHRFPTHICLEPGTYEYACPGCGGVRIFTVPRITC